LWSWRLPWPVISISIALPSLPTKDTIVFADFANSTGDSIFDDTLKEALTSSLRQSPFLNVLSDGKVGTTLKLMTLPANTRLTPEFAREVCQRANSKAWIGGSIASIGSEYVVGLKAVNCLNGETLAQEQSTAVNKEEVLDALGETAAKLRRELGEALATVEKFDTPLSQVTTSSLEALKAASLGNRTLHEKGTAAAIPFFQHAIELDPNFASAYANLGKMYTNLGERERAEELFTKAYSLRGHASEREKFDIDMYHEIITGDLESAARVYQEWLMSYPRDDVALGNLANVYTFRGRYQPAAELYKQALPLSPSNVVSYSNLALVHMSLNQFPDAHRTIQDALDHKLDADSLHITLYILAFLAGDEQGMREQGAWFEGKPENMDEFLMLQSSAEGYSGHLAKARELTQRAVEAAEHSGNPEAASFILTANALREAAFQSARVGAGGLLVHDHVPEGGDIRLVAANAKSGSLRPSQHRRRISSAWES
jgi:eukaryotic-like serine/threonine-protein kinase